MLMISTKAGCLPPTYLEPLYGSEDVSVQRLDTGEGEGERREERKRVGRYRNEHR